MKTLSRLGALFACLFVVAAGSSPTAQAEEFAPRTVIRKPFRAIVDAPTMDAVAASKKLHANELILGVVLNGEARAYPINMLTGPSREILNDKLGETAIAATW